MYEIRKDMDAAAVNKHWWLSQDRTHRASLSSELSALLTGCCTVSLWLWGRGTLKMDYPSLHSPLSSQQFTSWHLNLFSPYFLSWPHPHLNLHAPLPQPLLTHFARLQSLWKRPEWRWINFDPLAVFALLFTYFIYRLTAKPLRVLAGSCFQKRLGF